MQNPIMHAVEWPMYPIIHMCTKDDYPIFQALFKALTVIAVNYVIGKLLTIIESTKYRKISKQLSIDTYNSNP